MGIIIFLCSRPNLGDGHLTSFGFSVAEYGRQALSVLQRGIDVLGKTGMSKAPWRPRTWDHAAQALSLRAACECHGQEGDSASLLGLRIRPGTQRPGGGLLPPGGTLRMDPVSWLVGPIYQAVSDIWYSCESIHSFALFICLAM